MGRVALAGLARSTGGSFSAVADIRLYTGAMITNRDGIVGMWQAPHSNGVPPPLSEENELNLQLLGPGERAAIYDFELLSRIRFQVEGRGEASAMSIHHLAVEGRGKVGYQPLVKLARPTQKVFLDQLNLVEAYADLRADRAEEILSQLGASSFGSRPRTPRPAARAWSSCSSRRAASRAPLSRTPRTSERSCGVPTAGT